MHSGTTGDESDEVEFAQLHALDESVPLGTGELQGRARGVLGVPDIDRIADAYGNAGLDRQVPGDRGSLEAVLFVRVPFSVVDNHNVLLSKGINTAESLSARTVDGIYVLTPSVQKSSAGRFGLGPWSVKPCLTE